MHKHIVKYFHQFAIIVAFAGTALPTANAQQLGLLISDERYAQVPLLPTYSGVKYTEIPAKVSLKKYCPVPGDQRQTGSCVGWAVGYGALTTQRAIAGGNTNQAIITQQANSAAFLYSQVRQNKQDCTQGAYLEDALLFLKQQGDCLEQSFNYDQKRCEDLPNEAEWEEARSYRIQDFAAVFSADADAKAKIGKVCKVLATNTPLVVGMGITKSFFDILPGTTIWNPNNAEEVIGHHAMVLIGYNGVEKYFDLLNSFGASWGQNGFIRLSYDDFERLCRYAFVIVPAPETAIKANSTQLSPPTPAQPIKREMNGEFVFRRPAGFVQTESGEELMYFEEVGVQLADPFLGFYATKQPLFQVGDVFQLLAREVPRGCYVYVFSQGPDGVANQHFPKKQPKLASAGFMLDRAVELVIPGEESLLQLSLPGEDYLCILYSTSQIHDFEDRLAMIQDDSRDFPQRVNEAFADVLIQRSDTQFSANKMSFVSQASPSEGRSAAITILRVIAK